MAPPRDEGVTELIDRLEQASKIPAQQRESKVSAKVESVCTIAYEDGLSNTSLDRLLDIITLPNELDQTSTNGLIKNLYPATKVPDTIVIKIVGSLGHGQAKPSYNAQAALVKWLIMVYGVLENPKILSQLYSILFNLLDTIAIRMELIRRAGKEPPLVGLMRVFKDYYPDVIIGDMVSGRASVFTHPNPEWRQHLEEIQDIHFQRTQRELRPNQRAFGGPRRDITGGKQAKTSTIPQVHTFNAHESSVTLEEIEDLHDFVQRFEKIEPPNQLAAVIGDPLLQKFLQLKSSQVYNQRVDSWLFAFFEDQLQNPESSEVRIIEMLEGVRSYAQYTKILPPACFAYIKSMADSWNGIVGRTAILDLLCYTPLSPFEDLYPSILQPVEQAILEDETTEAKLDLLAFYRKLLDRWTVLLLAQPQQSPSAASTITSLVSHADILATTIVQCSLSISTLSKVLEFYESITSMISQPTLKDLVRIPIPPAELIHTLQFTQSLDILSRLCGILALYKHAFEAAMSPRIGDTSGSDTLSYPKDYVKQFNGFLMDVCNCIWRGRAFNTADMNALGCLLPKNTAAVLDNYVKGLGTSLSLPPLFSLSFSPVLCLLAISYVRELEVAAEDEIERTHRGPVTQASLKQLEKDGGLTLAWPDYRLGVLHYLESKGVRGVSELMYSTMKHLAGASETRTR
ncbi:uncharacterized protein BP5553_07083 [Venustampulla echinocandica]|uniref:Mis6-domain-containing protein n=1 Tax=Venustampulla echinocandica TaxID=2656787 RepID=A0A370TIG7_9HELO|nr:uncharacterized protein BP5553_07083 [Venustampulla echinocandica]RDL35152.1 hypothetical protein BP5553_07083 [Venustampulla echinocandica]